MRTRLLTCSIALLAAACSSVSGGTPGETSCTTNEDCSGDEVCVLDRCFPADYEGTYCEYVECGHGTCVEGTPPTCTCEAGYAGPSCADVDECAEGSDDCADEATCTNTGGGFECVCREGWTGDGVTCADVDECTAGTDDCGANTICENLPGTFDCDCAGGYQGNGVTCTDVDECDLGIDACDVDASCTNTPGRYDCDCNPGFTGDGLTCADVDECAGDPCDDDAACTNLPGTYLCECALGFVGDGVTCTPAIGHVVWMGHDFYDRNDDIDRLVGNSVALAQRVGPIRVLGWTEYADLAVDGEVANVDAAIAARLAVLGRTATITHVNDYIEIPPALPDYDVLVIYEMENGGDGPGVGTTLGPFLRSFVARGGVVIAMDYTSNGWRLLDAARLMRFAGIANYYGGVGATVTVPSDPVADDVNPMYTGTDGTLSAWTNDGTVVSIANDAVPVVVHKVWGQARFDGTFGAWETLADGTSELYALSSFAPAHLPDLFNMWGGTGQRYSTTTGTWSDLGFPGAHLNLWFQMAPVGRMLFGFTNSAPNNIFRLDVHNGLWSDVGDFAGVAEYPMTVADEAGRLYGYTNDGDLVVYDPSSGGVSYLPTAVPALRGGGSLYETRMAYDPGTRSIFFTGYPNPELYRYDLDTGSTFQVASIPEPAMNDIFCGDRSGHIYAAGDFGGFTMWQYDIATDTWNPLPDLPETHQNNGSCLVSEDGHVYVGTGDTRGLFRLPLN